MDIKWKDGKGNILNANKDRIIYLNAETNAKTIIKNKEVKKVIVIDGMINIFRDFENDLELTIIIPKKHRKNAVRIFNEYDKTGQMYNSGRGNIFTEIFLDAFIDITLTLTNPISLFLGIPIVSLIIFLTVKAVLEGLLGNAGVCLSYFILLSYPVYGIINYILTIIKRRSLKEV